MKIIRKDTHHYFLKGLVSKEFNQMPAFIRKSTRLPFSQIYNSNNSFFVTICVEGRMCIFVEENFNSPKITVNNGQINLSATVKIVKQTWLNLPDYFENILLDEFVVMPNHFHGIITFLDVPKSKFTGKESNLGKIIKYFKARSTLQIKQLLVEEKLVSPLSPPATSPKTKPLQNGELKFASTKTTMQLDHTQIVSTKDLIEKHNTIWQKSFHDHVIRNEKDLHTIREYIYNNPLQWDLDSLNPRNSG